VAGLSLVARHEDLAWGRVIAHRVMVDKRGGRQVLVSRRGQMLDCSATMHTGMTFSTERDQILAAIITRVATIDFVVNLKMGHCAAQLASPAVAT
jgi:hypothetical protein